ncbi:MAG: hypothetical protein JWN04_6025 [Myxococcaceae bacterium]|nr:hypothetical protein [Myxococcaceae bacterium]
MPAAAVFRSLSAVVHPIVAHDGRDAQSILLKHRCAPEFLRSTMRFYIAPARNRSFISPAGEREEAFRISKALKALNRDEPVRLGELGSERRGYVEVSLSGRRVRPDLENDDDHARSPLRCGGRQKAPSTTSRKLRSSRTIKRFASAMAKFARPSGSCFSRAR